MTKPWVVYEDKDGKLHAVEDEYSFDQDVFLSDAGYKIVGHPSAKTAQDAIAYMEAIL